MPDLTALATRAAAEIRDATAAVDPAELAALVTELASAKRIVAHGLGREGLMMRALVMRLYHLGLDAHVWGDMSTPPLGRGDLLLVSAGPGGFATIDSLLGIAQGAGARVACITARPTGSSASAADLVLTIPAQTMASDQRAMATSVLPMGSLFEGAQYLTFELLVLALRDHLGADFAAMRARHTNLE